MSSKPASEIERVARGLQAKGVAVAFMVPEVNTDTIVNQTAWSDLCACDLLYYRSGLGEAGRHLLIKYSGPDCKIINRALLENPLLSNKAFQLASVLTEGISTPLSIVNVKDFLSAAAKLGLPFIYKSAYGLQGRRVFLIETETDFLQAKRHIPSDSLAQAWVKSNGDYRVLVVGGEAIAIYKRVRAVEEFRSNMALGATGEVVADSELRRKLANLAERVAETLGLDMAGVDIIECQETQRLYFLEANAHPGWKGLEATLGIDVSEKVAQYFLAQISL